MDKKGILGSIEELSKDAMFLMSLTSRELFHSNVWAWMIRKYPSIFTSVFYPKYDGISTVEVFREEKHYDFLLKINDKHIIIENKFKCMPNKKQLKKYYDECKKEKKEITLISYFKPTFSLSDMNMNGDDYSYEVIKNGLLEALEKSNLSKQSDDYVIINNYIKFLGLLNNLKNSIIINSDDKIGKLMEIIKDSDIQKEAEKINFSKTIERIFISKLTEAVLEDFKFKEQIDEIRIDCGRDLNVFSDILFYFGAWDENYNDKNLCYLGISLWGNNYRYYAGLKKGEKNKNKEEGYDYLKNNYGDFFEQEKNEGKWGGYNNKTEMYLYKKINISDYTVKDLKNKVQNDLEKALSYRKRIDNVTIK